MFVFRKIWRALDVCLSGSKKCLFFGKFGVLCFLEIPFLRFALLPYFRRVVGIHRIFTVSTNSFTSSGFNLVQVLLPSLLKIATPLEDLMFNVFLLKKKIRLFKWLIFYTI